MSHGTFQDHFSKGSSDYARYRPTYPRRLFAWLASQVRQRRRAWDCATGNGQAAVALAEFFAEVVATDASAEQLEHAAPHRRVVYARAAAETSGLPPASVDLVTVAQAVHWLDFDAFWAEVRRVLVPGGVIAVWCYGTFHGEPAVDALLQRFYDETVGPFWPPERRFIDDAYRTLPFPFEEIHAPELALEETWTLEQLLGYLGTWSATRRCREATGEDPVEALRGEIAAVWGDPDRPRRLVWPLHLRAGRR
jgi:SAM-dependent methyltransferase